MIGFKKNFLKDRTGTIASPEISVSSTGGDSEGKYPEKIAGLTYDQMHQMYKANIWVRASIDKIVDRVSDINPIIKPLMYDKTTGHASDKTLKNMDKLADIITKPNKNFESFDSSLRKKITRDLLKYDAAAIEIVKESDLIKDEISLELYSIPGNTIKMNVDDKGMFHDKAYVQVDEEIKEVASWPLEKMMYFMSNPQANRVYGFSKLESLSQTVTAELYASQYNLDFFYNNATPRFGVFVEGVGVGQAEPTINRFRTWWRQELEGKPHKPIIIATESGNIKFEKVGLTNDEMQFHEYSRWLLTKIMAIFDIQPIVLGVIDTGMGKLNSAEQIKLFKQDAVRPHLKLFVERFNNQVVFGKAGLGMDDIYLDFDLDLVDKKEQAEWHEIYSRMGVLTINEIRVRGLGLNPVPWGDVPYLQNNLVPFGFDPDTGASAVPVSPEQSIVQAPDETAMIPTAISSKGQFVKYLDYGNGMPVGWEKMETSDRLELVNKLLRKKEKMLSKVFIIPKPYKRKEQDG